LTDSYGIIQTNTAFTHWSSTSCTQVRYTRTTENTLINSMQITVKILCCLPRLWVAELQFCWVTVLWDTQQDLVYCSSIQTKYKFYWISKQSIATFICYCKLVQYIWVQYSL